MFFVKRNLLRSRIGPPQLLFRSVPFAENTKEPRHILDHFPRVFPGKGPIRACLEKLDRPIQEGIINNATAQLNGTDSRLSIRVRA